MPMQTSNVVEMFVPDHKNDERHLLIHITGVRDKTNSVIDVFIVHVDGELETTSYKMVQFFKSIETELLKIANIGGEIAKYFDWYSVYNNMEKITHPIVSEFEVITEAEIIGIPFPMTYVVKPKY